MISSGWLGVLMIVSCGQALERGPFHEAWRTPVALERPPDPATRQRVDRAVGWLTEHLVDVRFAPGNAYGPVIAWKDPTLAPEQPDRLAGYLITDTLWAGQALRLHEPATAARIEAGLTSLGWNGNGLHDVLFRRLDRVLHRSADEDLMHGHSLGVFGVGGSTSVDVRVFRQRWDADYAVGHPLLFAEHAVYEALFDFWQGRERAARERLRAVVQRQSGAEPPDELFWDGELGVLVDHVNREQWCDFEAEREQGCRHYTFKLGVLLHAIRLMGMQDDLGAELPAMRERLWDAQGEDGGVAHFVVVRAGGAFERPVGSTDEATAIAVLSELVRPMARAR